ncbi:MAG: flagellar assembly protein FliH [Thermosediminibacteraceae bacterium]|nr:flagellar assembly protein FliH [Thermosediminibacteraceae bacterium]
MSKVLKQVEVSRETPFRIKDMYSRAFKSDDVLRERAYLPIEMFYKDNASRLYEDAMRKAAEIIEKAKRESEAIIQEAKEKQEQMQREAFEKGYAEGFRQGAENAKKELTSLFEENLKQFNELRETLFLQNKEYLKTLEKECVKLALHIAEKILRSHAQVDSSYIIGIVSESLEKLGEDKDIIVRISEKDFERIEGEIQAIKQKARYKKVNFVKDPTLSEGDCIILGNCFEIDGGLFTQLENLKTELIEMDVLGDD